MVLPRTLEKIRTQCMLSEVVGKSVRLIKKGREFSGLCPFHKEKTPSFTVNDEKGFYHCFGCGAHGDVFDYFMEIENLPFMEAVERAGALVGVEVEKEKPEFSPRKAQEKKSLLDILELACTFFEKQLQLTPKIREYLRGRGLTPETIKTFRLGFAPAGSGLKQYLASKDISEAKMIEAGLLITSQERGETYDRFRERVIFPILNRQNQVIAFGGRALGEAMPKYLNSPETPVFHKGHVLYNFAGARALNKDLPLLVAEGYMDVIALASTGKYRAVAPLGTAVTESQLQEIWRLSSEPVFSFDGDAAGKRAALKVAEKALPYLRPGYTLYFAQMPSGEDPDSLVRRGANEILDQVFGAPHSLSVFLWEALLEGHSVATPDKQAKFRHDINNLLKNIENYEIRQAYKNEYMHLFHGLLRQKNFRKIDKNQQVNYNITRQLLDSNHIQQKILLATVLNHPYILDRVLEQLMTLSLRGELYELRERVFFWYQQEQNLDKNKINELVEKENLKAAVDTLLSQVKIHAPFIEQGSSQEDVLEGWQHIWEKLLYKQDLAHHMEEVKKDLEEQMDAKTWQRLRALKQEVKS